MKQQSFFSFVLAWACAIVLGWGIALAAAAQQQAPAQPQPAAQQAPAQQQNAAAPAGDAANGRKLFVSFGCYECHGYEAQGGSAGPRLAPRPIPYAQLMKYVRHPTGEMPPFTEKTVKDAELTDIYAFLRSQPPAADVDKIPLLK